MLSDKDRSEIEQAIAGVSELYPRMLKSMYDSLIREGFNENTALQLTKVMMGKMISKTIGLRS